MNLKSNELLLISGNDIPFIEGQLTIHQPTLKEIAYIGEEAFFTGCELLKFSKEILTDEDKKSLEQYSDFHILMSVINDESGATKFNSASALMVLDLLFPLYTWKMTNVGIEFTFRENEEIKGYLTPDNYSVFKDILKTIFCLEKTSSEQGEYDPEGDLAKRIADKFKKRKQKLAELQPKSKKVSIYSRYVSILAVGEHKDINELMNYTVYQLLDEFQRYELKSAYDVFFKARLAGAKDMKEPEDWMKDIH